MNPLNTKHIQVNFPEIIEVNRLNTGGSLSGNGGGLYTAGFFSHDEWTFGPYYFEEGFRVLLHPSGTTPLTLSSKGIPLVPTFISEIAITRHESTFLV